MGIDEQVVHTRVEAGRFDCHAPAAVSELTAILALPRRVGVDADLVDTAALRALVGRRTRVQRDVDVRASRDKRFKCITIETNGPLETLRASR